MAEGILERLVQHRSTNVEKGLHGRPVPAHLLFLVHTLGHDLVHRTLNKRRRDRLAASTPGCIVLSACPGCARGSREKFADVSLKTVDADCLTHVLALSSSGIGQQVYAGNSVQRPRHRRHFAHSRL
jgi:hypothetical protein